MLSLELNCLFFSCAYLRTSDSFEVPESGFSGVGLGTAVAIGVTEELKALHDAGLVVLYLNEDEKAAAALFHKGRSSLHLHTSLWGLPLIDFAVDVVILHSQALLGTGSITPVAVQQVTRVLMPSGVLFLVGASADDPAVLHHFQESPVLLAPATHSIFTSLKAWEAVYQTVTTVSKQC